MDLAGPAQLKRRFLLPPADGVASYRYVIDVAAQPDTVMTSAAAAVTPAPQIRTQFLPVKRPALPLKKVVVIDEAIGKKPNEGFNALTAEWVDMFKAGIVDPTKVVRCALQNAASIAGLMLTTNTMVTSIPDEKKAVEGSTS